MRKRAAEVGLHKILLFPEKLAALSRAAFGDLDNTYPISVELSLTNRCNQNCLWCSDKNLRGRSPDRMGMDILRPLFRDLAAGGARGITIEGGGEPTLAPFFGEAVMEARACGLAVGLISNGLALPHSLPPNFYENFEWIRISLDAANQRQYKDSKGTDGFEAVLENIRGLAQAAPNAALGVGYVLTRRNDDPEPLKALILSLRQMKAHYLHIRPVVDHPELVSSRDLDFLEKLESPDFSINLAALTDNRPSGNNSLPCLAHSLSVVIGADALVWLCGRLNTSEAAKPIGSLTEASFHDIWHGPERALQAKLAASAEFCKSHCPQCRMTKYNQLLADMNQVKTRNFI